MAVFFVSFIVDVLAMKKIIIFISLIFVSTGFTDDLDSYLKKNNTSSFLVSEKGKIVVEKEFKVRKDLKPKSLMFFNLFRHGLIEGRSQEDVASIQKSIVSILIGIAQQKGLIDINESVTSYIGSWTQLSAEKESLIKVRNLLTMTSGLDVDLNYNAEPGLIWLYNTRAYSQLINVLEKTSGLSINKLSSEWLFDKLQMNETFWKERKKGRMGFPKDSAKYGLVTTAKDLLKFGEFILNGGEVGTNHVISDIDFFDETSAPFTKSINS